MSDWKKHLEIIGERPQIRDSWLSGRAEKHDHAQD